MEDEESLVSLVSRRGALEEDFLPWAISSHPPPLLSLPPDTPTPPLPSLLFLLTLLTFIFLFFSCMMSSFFLLLPVPSLPSPGPKITK